MEKVSDAWSHNRGACIIGNEMEASFRSLFLIEGNMQVPEMYRAIDAVMRRINTYEFEYEADEQEANQMNCKLSQLNPCRLNRKKMELVESYKLKINLDRAIGWMLMKIMESKLAPISIMPKQI